MKYILISLLIVLVSIGIPIGILLLIEKIKNKKFNKWLKIISCICSSFLLIILILIIYTNIYYKATDDVIESLKDTDTVIVNDEKDYYLFDNMKNSKDAIIFYGGAKVEEKAYATLMKSIASNGIDVYLMKMPLHIALLGKNKADIIMKEDLYENVYLMGHSLGGATLSLYLSTTSYDYKGIIFLASYPNKEIKNNISSLSIYGSCDNVLNHKTYEKNKDMLPNNYKEYIIEGGNHSYFGNYGEQRKDGKATITRALQQELTVNRIIDFINKDLEL